MPEFGFPRNGPFACGKIMEESPKKGVNEAGLGKEIKIKTFVNSTWSSRVVMSIQGIS